MKKSIFPGTLLAFSTLVLIGCQPAPISQEEAQTNIVRTVQNERVEIPLDDKMPGVKVSLARNFYFVIDGSGSMAYAPENTCSGDKSFGTKLEGAKWAVREFMQKVPNDVNLGLYVFDSRGSREVVPLGSGNNQRFLQEIENIRASGGTPLAESIRFGTGRLIEQYKKQLGYGEYRLVVVTDGQADSIPEAALYSIKFGMPIYAIGLCIGNDHPLQRYALSYRAADSSEDLRKGLEQTLAELPNFNVSEFKPAGAESVK